MERYNLKNKNLFKLNEKQQKVLDNFTASLNKDSYKKNKNCNICKESSFLEISDIDRYGINRPTHLCKNCGYMFGNPQLTDEVHKKYYESFYRENDREFTIPDKEFYELEKHRGTEIINYLHSNKVLNDNNTCLDVGCGSGATSFIFANIFKNVIAIDLANEYTKNVEKLDNLKVLNTTIQDSFFNNKKFGFINYCHVFEHLNDPLKEIKRIEEILDDNGYLYIEVPGIYHIDYWYKGNFFHSLETDHTHFFTLNTLKNFMETNNFEFVAGDELIRSIWKKKKNENNYKIINEYSKILQKINKYDNKLRIYHLDIKLKLKKPLVSLFKLLLKSIGMFSIIKNLYYKNKNKKYIYKEKKLLKLF